MREARQNVLSMSVFLVVAVVMVGANTYDWGQQKAPALVGFGPEALPFACDFTREGAGPDDMQGRFTLTFDQSATGPFPHCATLRRGTPLRPVPGGEVICLAHQEATLQDLWEDANGGALRIFGHNGARYIRRERSPGADAFSPTIDVSYLGSCEGAR